MSTTAAIVGVILAGILGTVANSFAISYLFGVEAMPLILDAGRLAVAILVAILLIPIFARMGGFAAWIVALAALTVIPSLLAVYVFAAEAPWSVVLGVNFVYALVATIVFVAMRKG
ncbi:hypothetical protein [Profundibacterium mesophilum]|uniref:Uncharacterized protein n=1 Tax=Profundibacterium mesophilum KAUST100406-0324 TaxID=1037889 RepID=A0A921NS82_9RHOB|nr:hypothetical protein [Profundibacterium mesophilum]KAF0676892.1 hypothetical protein PMES_00688 [Profundibacterium mesophilum KAUST100406-0324]